MEGHFVHADKDGNLAVIAVMYKLGAENPEIKKLWKQMPVEVGSKDGLAAQVRAQQLMPADKDYYRFNGSLTTPPCSEGVVWIVMKNPVTVSESQVKQFTDVMVHPNNRPVQPVNARPACSNPSDCKIFSVRPNTVGQNFFNNIPPGCCSSLQSRPDLTRSSCLSPSHNRAQEQ